MQTTQLDQLLKFLTDTLQEGKAFSVEQAPQFVRELLLWRFWEATIWMVCGLLGLFVIATVGVKVAQTLLSDFEDDRQQAAWWIRLFCALVAVIVIGVNADTMIKIKVAPRLVLIEEVRDLIAGPRR